MTIMTTGNRQQRRAEKRQHEKAQHSAERQSRQTSASQQAAPTPSQSRGLLAAKALDPHAFFRDRLAEAANAKGHWAGIPMPLSGQHLVVEPTFPHADVLMKLGLAEGASEADADDGWRLRNKWYSFQRRSDILIMEKEGKISWGQLPAVHHIGMDLHTMGCSEAWGLEQEQRALQLLGGMISHHQMKMYVLTGMFIERSKRSGVMYIFRRLKPTVACRARPGMPDEPNKSMEILCCLCMHPIAYYHGSWAGAMCPTDDVVAHLALMRGDERLFWARSNHHPPYRPEAGL